MSTPKNPSPTPAVPRSSASLIIINPQNEVLLVCRNPESRSFAGVSVFPGGNYDANQDGDSLITTALRETFEESGLLLATLTNTPPNTILDKARLAIHARQLSFSTFLADNQLTLDRSLLLPFTRWITPIHQPRRFTTQFYLTFLPDTDTDTTFSQGERHERLPTPDGGLEIVSARFIHPSLAIAEFEQKRITLMPPQYYILHALAGLLPGSKRSTEGVQEVNRVAQGPFGAMEINPVMLGKDAEGRVILTYEGDETRGGVEGRLHRIVGKMGKSGMEDATLQRNFDIFTEPLPPPAKL